MSGTIDWTRASLTRLQSHDHPRSSPLLGITPTRSAAQNLPENSSSTAAEAAKNTKCLNIPSATSTTLLTIPTLLTMCGITTQWWTRSLKFWPGYLHLSPGHGTTTSKPVGSTRWETGFYKLRNIGIGLAVSMGVNLVVQPCFAMEGRGLARPILGKREDARGKERHF